MQQQTRRRAASHLDSTASAASSTCSAAAHSASSSASLLDNGGGGGANGTIGALENGGGGGVRSLPGRVSARPNNPTANGGAGGGSMPTARRKRRRRRTTRATLRYFFGTRGSMLARESAAFRMVVIALVLISCGFVGLLVKVTLAGGLSGGSSGKGAGDDDAVRRDESHHGRVHRADTIDDAGDGARRHGGRKKRGKSHAGKGRKAKKKDAADGNSDVVRAKLIEAATKGREKLIADEKAKARKQKEAAANKNKESKELDLTFKTQLEGAPPCTEVKPDDIAYTLVTQLSSDRLWMMSQHCVRWGLDAPISAVVYTDRGAEEVLDQMVKDGCNRQQLTVQTLSTAEYGETEYPVNRMRNMALSAVRTTHVMYVDVDFWESHRLRTVLEMPSIREELANDHKLAAVVPAFQINRQCKEYRDCREENLAKMPNVTEQMMQMVKDAQAGAFDPTNRGGHGSTSYGAWYLQKEGELYDIPCFKSNRYEPYMAFRYCADLPPFQEQFTGYGKNKMTWVMQMRRTGWDFTQLGQVFLVHYPHLDSKSRLEWNEGPKAITEPVKDAEGKLRRRTPGEVEGVDWAGYQRGQVDRMYVAFRDWLESDVPDSTKVHPCKDATDDDEMLWVNKKE